MKELKKCIRTCSIVADMSTPSVWQLFSATDWAVSDTYEKMHECGIPIELQRTGSLLNYCAVRSVGTIKTLEPEMYAKINARFNNVDFIASFSKSGYYNIAKPKDIAWSGTQHIKAGMSEAQITAITDLYDYFMKKLGLLSEKEFNDTPNANKPDYFLANEGIYGYRDGNSFKFSRSLELTKKLGSALTPINPFQFTQKYFKDNISEANSSDEAILSDIASYFNFSEQDMGYFESLQTIHTTWEEYCLYLLNTSDEPAKSIWREKLVTSILSWKYAEGSVESSTIDALGVLSEIDPMIVGNLQDDYWTKADYHVGATLPISGKTALSLSHYPQQSLEKEALECIEHIINNCLWNEIDNSPSLKKMIEKFESTDVKTMLTPTQYLILMYGNDNVKKKNKIDENTEKKYENIVKFDDIREALNHISSKEELDAVMKTKEGQKIAIWVKRVLDGNAKWFKEQIHSTSSWKRFTIGILKNDITLKYLGFAPCSKERLARAQAMQAFSQKQEDRAKAEKEAQRLVKQIEKENAVK